MLANEFEKRFASILEDLEWAENVTGMVSLETIRATIQMLKELKEDSDALQALESAAEDRRFD